MKFLVRVPALYTAPASDTPPPLWIRGLLILTCTLRVVLPRLERRPEGHGPHHADPDRRRPDRLCAEPRAAGIADRGIRQGVRRRLASRRAPSGAGFSILGDPRPAVTDYIHAHKISRRHLSRARRAGEATSPTKCKEYGTLAKTPFDKVQNVRNDMYLASEAMRILGKDKESELNADEKSTARAPTRKTSIISTKFIPSWVKIIVADRARSRHHGRLEAHRRHRRREDRQDASDLRPGRGGRTRRRWRRSAPPTASACPSRRRTCCLRASPARCWPTARACNGRPCATSRSAGS